jgi:hypothetical protein
VFEAERKKAVEEGEQYTVPSDQMKAIKRREFSAEYDELLKDVKILNDNWAKSASWKDSELQHRHSKLLFRGTQINYATADEVEAKTADKLLHLANAYKSNKYNSWTSSPELGLEYAKADKETQWTNGPKTIPAVLILRPDYEVPLKERCHWIAGLSAKPDDVETLCPPNICATVISTKYSAEKEKELPTYGVVVMKQITC